jgi:DNA-binding CsgD family transcriptional regulator
MSLCFHKRPKSDQIKMISSDADYKVKFPTPSLEWASPDFQPPPSPVAELDNVLLTIASGLIEAATDLDLLVPLLKRIAAAFDSNVAHVAFFDFQRGVTLLHAFGSEMFPLDPVVLRDYEDAAPIDARASFVVGFPGRAISTHDMDIDKQATLPVVAMAPPEFGQMMMINEIDQPFWGFLSVLRHKDAPPYSQHEKARLAALSVWFGRAMHIFRAIEAARGASLEVSNVVDLMSSPMALAGRDGRLLKINAAARDILGLRDSDTWSGAERWHIALGEARKSGQAMTEIKDASGTRQGARLSRLPGNDELILVELAIDTSHPTIALDRFCGHYGLTRAERQVLGGLVDGATVSSLPDILDRGSETVKSQLRSIREKTGMRSQVAIVSSFQRFKELQAAV